MKYIALLFALCTLILISLESSETVIGASADPVACPMHYVPVCGTVQVQCVRAPCDPVRETFSNSCVAGAAGATDITSGACQETTTRDTGSLIIGGDRDIHGCLGPAGYSWSPILQQCIRPWEFNTKKSPISALRAHPWKLISLNHIPITHSGTITFDRHTFHADLCNIMNGKYVAPSHHLVPRQVISTMMYCEGDIMQVEHILGTQRFSYMVGDTTLILTTKKGDVLYWEK